MPLLTLKDSGGKERRKLLPSNCRPVCLFLSRRRPQAADALLKRFVRSGQDSKYEGTGSSGVLVSLDTKLHYFWSQKPRDTNSVSYAKYFLWSAFFKYSKPWRRTCCFGGFFSNITFLKLLPLSTKQVLTVSPKLLMLTLLPPGAKKQQAENKGIHFGLSLYIVSPKI